MRLLKTPYQGYLGDIDQAFYWKFDESVGTATVVDWGTKGAHLVVTGSPPVQASLFNQDHKSFGSRRFASVGVMYAQSGLGLNGHLTTSTDWAMSGFMAMSTGATQTLLEYARDGTPVDVTEALALGIYYLDTLKRVCVTFETAVNTFVRLVTTASIPSACRLGIVKKREGTGASYSYKVYVNDQIVEVMTTTENPASTIGSAGRWISGGSLRHGSADGLTPALLANGIVDEWALWPRPFPHEKMVGLYGDCVRPFDQKFLMETNNQQTRTRVLVADSAGVMVDFTSLSGRNWVQSVTVSEAIEEPVNKAVVKFRRNAGNYADLSPLNTISEFAGALAHRRKIIIQTAVVPSLWTMQGWEWENRFEGVIDSWDIEGAAVEIKCIDSSYALVDQFVMEPRVYNFYSANKLAETHVQQIIDQNVPALKSPTSTVTLGYLGGTPVLYTEAGSAASVALENSAWNLRFNDTTSAPVMENLRAVAEMVAFDLRFKYHEPWGTHRLTMYNPPRGKSILFNRAEEDADGLVMITTTRPHGMNVGQTFTVSAASFGGTFTVGEIVSYYRFKATSGVAGTPTLVTSGSVGYGAHMTLSGADITDVDPVSSNIADIRNHIVVRYGRDGTSSSLAATAVSSAGGVVTITLPENIADLDPDNSGINLELSQATTTATPFNAKYTGTITGSRTITCSELITPSLSTSSVRFNSDYVRFKQVSSTYTPSVQTIGLRQAGIYEGSTTNIDTLAEAQALADRVLADLSLPQADLAIKTRILPLQLHDTLNLSADAKGRWTGTLNTAIVGLSEKYESNSCQAEYKLRGTQPSAGRNSGRVLIGPMRPGTPSNNVTDIASMNLQVSAVHARAFPIRWDRRQDKRAMRHDRSEVHISTASGFIPSTETLAGETRGNHLLITHAGLGVALTPGTTYYTKIRHRDVFDNLTLSTEGGIPPTRVRFLTQAPGAYAVKDTTTATRVLVGSSTYTPLLLDLDTGADASSLTFDVFGNYSTTSFWFQAPCSGQVTISSRTRWITGNKVNPMVSGRLVHFPAGDTSSSLFFSSASVTGSAASTNVTLCLAGTVYCNSGDRVQIQIATDTTTCMIHNSTATIGHSYVSFQQVSER